MERTNTALRSIKVALSILLFYCDITLCLSLGLVTRKWQSILVHVFAAGRLCWRLGIYTTHTTLRQFPRSTLLSKIMLDMDGYEHYNDRTKKKNDPE